MKALFLTTVAATTIAAAGAAFAADLGVPYKAPPVAPPPAFSWTGCYIGTNSGVGTSTQKWQDTVADGNIDGIAGSNRTASTNGSGGIFGGQVGCDMQWAGNWVFGLQGMFDGANINSTNQDQFNAPWTLTNNINWFASATARVGWSANNILVYAKGGAAWVHDKLEVDNSGVFLGNPQFTKVGWTVGTGLEWAFTPGFSVFIEGNYYSFGNSTQTLLNVPGSDNPPFTFNTKQNFETLSVGLNYRWGWGGPSHF